MITGTGYACAIGVQPTEYRAAKKVKKAEIEGNAHTEKQNCVQLRKPDHKFQ